MRLKPVFLCLILLFAVVSFNPACTKKKSKRNYGLKISETLRINLDSEPPTLDWIKSSDLTSSRVVENIMDGLVDYEYGNASDKKTKVKLVPALAISWSSSKDLKEWTFILRENVQWHDGERFKGEQVLDGIERLLNPVTGAKYSYFLYDIVNARAYNQGKIKNFKEVGVKLVGSNKVVFKLNAPLGYFPHLLTHHSTFPIRKDLIDQYGDSWAEDKNMVALGAYKLKKWVHDEAVVLVRNENYWNGLATIKNVIFYVLNETSTALNLFDSGKLDALTTVPESEILNLVQREEYRSQVVLGIYYYGFNITKPPMNNPLVRKAIAHAIDRSEVTNMMGDGKVPITGWSPPGLLGYDPSLGLKFNVQRAQNLLEQAGYKDRSLLPKIQIGFNTMGRNKRIAENIQQQLNRNLNIQVELFNEEWKVYLETLQTDAPQIYRHAWIGDYPDPNTFFSLLTSYSSNNHTRWKNKRYDKLVEAASSLLGEEKRKTLYREAQKILLEEEAVVVPIYAYTEPYLVSSKIKNFPLNFMKRFPFHRVKKINKKTGVK